MTNRQQTIEEFVARRNHEKLLFTAGPASLLPENLAGLRPCFGRGDQDYAEVEARVLDALRKMSGHAHIARMQGSASLALEIMALNFLYGRVLVVSTGYYSDRLLWLAQSAMRRLHAVTAVIAADWQEIDAVSGQFDWVLACYTETSTGVKVPAERLAGLSSRLSARLMLDATASIGLESSHDLADAIAYSSCKGLFGLTGAAFVAYHRPPTVEVDSFYLSLSSHLDKKMTGPYHAIASLDEVMPVHDARASAVRQNKARFLRQMAAHLTVGPEHQPWLCTHVSCRIASRDPRAILYASRSGAGGSVVCHLGEVHLGRSARGDMLDVLEIVP